MAGHQAELTALLSRLGMASAPLEARTAALAALARLGDLAAGLRLVEPLRELRAARVVLNAPAPCVTLDLSGPSLNAAEGALRQLNPWRKGPFRLERPMEGALVIDAEWRSDWKWQRLVDLGVEWSGKRVLDVGTGNGYFLLRLLGGGAAAVTGLEPSLKSILQYLSIVPVFGVTTCALWPVRLEAVGPALPRYDLVMSMGVLYHQRAPLTHLRDLHGCLEPDGQLVLESIVTAGPESIEVPTGGRYAGMRNVYLVPTRDELGSWVEASGFDVLNLGPPVLVTSQEQRSTPWSEGPSLEQFLEPTYGDPDAELRKTCEGFPRPARCLLLARARGRAR